MMQNNVQLNLYQGFFENTIIDEFNIMNPKPFNQNGENNFLLPNNLDENSNLIENSSLQGSNMKDHCNHKNDTKYDLTDLNNYYWKVINNPLENVKQINHCFNNSNTLAKKKPFTSEEDELLISLVNSYGIGSWPKISQEMHKYNFDRNGRQCRDRYYHYLDPNVNVNANWSSDEDYLIMQYVEKEGKKWKGMEKLFPGRTEVSLRNRYNLLLRKMTKEERRSQKIKKRIDEEELIYEKHEKIKIKKNISSKNREATFHLEVTNSDENVTQNSINLDTTTIPNEKSKCHPKIFDDSVFDTIFGDCFIQF